MSYCRWSSDNWKSDVYTYSHYDGSWTTHVAGNRKVGLDMLPPEPLRFIGEYSPFAWLVAYRIHNNAFELLRDEYIELPHSGQTFKDASPQSCADTLRMLKGIGYHVPDGVIEELDDEEVEAA
jgi:hypothetical protein